MSDVTEGQKFEQVFQALITADYNLKDVQTFYYLMKQCVSLYRFFSQIQSEEGFLKEDSLYGVYFGEIIPKDASEATVSEQNRELLDSLKTVTEKSLKFGNLMSKKKGSFDDDEKQQGIGFIYMMSFHMQCFFQDIIDSVCNSKLTIPVNLIFMECDAILPQKDERETSKIFEQIEGAITLLRSFEEMSGAQRKLLPA